MIGDGRTARRSGARPSPPGQAPAREFSAPIIRENSTPSDIDIHRGSVRGSFIGWSRFLERCATLPLYVGALLMPYSAAGQNSTFTVESGCMYARIHSPAKRRPNRIAFSAIRTQLYDYLKTHKCIGLTEGRARVYSTRGQYVCIYDPKDNKVAIYPCAWTRTEMLSKCTLCLNNFGVER